MADQIQYQYSALEEGINAMKQTTDQLHQLTDELRQQTQGVLQSWNAAASQSYQQLSSQINNDFTSMNEMLGQLQQATHQGSQDMNDQDRQLAKSFEK